MMALLGRTRLVLGVAILLSGAGVLAWTGMPREEDPRLSDRIGQIVVPFPGADAEQIERLVVEPIEDELAQVDELKTVEVDIRTSVAVFRLELLGSVTDTETAWDAVDEAIEKGSLDLPAAALKPRFQHDMMNTEAVLLAITGSSDRLVLADEADRLRDHLLTVDDVSEVVISGDPAEQISILLDDATARGLGLTPERLAALIESRNVALPGGSLQVGDRQLTLQPNAELETVEELARTPIPLADGTAVPLGRIAEVRRTIAEPARELARHRSEPAVMVGVIGREAIDAVQLGEDVRAAVASFAPTEGLTLDEIAFQPAQVEGRLSELGLSLAIGVAIVALVLLLTMGARLGLMVAAIVPLVTLASLAVYAVGGGVLHQMAVAALVVSLGLLVDNAIVMAEAIQRALDEGATATDAARDALKDLAIPLASATATTLASFVPMLLAPGTVGDFTRAIPIVVMLTLVVSYGYAIAVTPILARLTLRPSKKKGMGLVERMARKVATAAVAHPARALLVVVLLVGASASTASMVQKDFFPASDRSQLVVSIAMPEGTHLQSTDDATRMLERALAERPEVLAVTSVVGRSAPPFYYNIPRRPSASHLGQIVVATRTPADVHAIQARVRQLAREQLPDAVVVARRLEQGPPVPAPIQVRLLGEDLHELHLAADEVRRVLRDDPRTHTVRADHGPGSPSIALAIDDAATNRNGLGRVHVASALLARTHGHRAGDFRGGDDPTPIVIRSPEGERADPSALTAIDLPAGDGWVSVAELATATTEFGPAVIHRRNRERFVSVLAEVEDGETYAAIVADVAPTLSALDLPRSVRLEQGGAVESSATANEALGSRAPFGVLLLLAVLLAQFDSFRKVAIVMVTAPLAMMGIWPGLLALDLPFGFVALLGAIALIGIVVNGGIVLIDLADRRIAEGATRDEALVEAVGRRTRPILLTAATTVAGLTPLLFSESTLWPPMAAAMISGLVVATLLTLVAVPALYRLFFREPTSLPTAEVSS